MADDNEDGGGRVGGGDAPSGPVMVMCFYIASFSLSFAICVSFVHCFSGPLVSFLGNFPRETETSEL
jgi:hypothetical protein